MGQFWDMTKRPGSKTKAQLRLSQVSTGSGFATNLIRVLIKNRPKTHVAWVKTHFAIGVSVDFTGPLHRKPSPTSLQVVNPPSPESSNATTRRPKWLEWWPANLRCLPGPTILGLQRNHPLLRREIPQPKLRWDGSFPSHFRNSLSSITRVLQVRQMGGQIDWFAWNPSCYRQADVWMSYFCTRM